jgi:phosphoribosylamine-glycine ligase
MEEALKTAYENVDIIQFEGKNFRTDIGFDLK